MTDQGWVRDALVDGPRFDTLQAGGRYRGQMVAGGPPLPARPRAGEWWHGTAPIGPHVSTLGGRRAGVYTGGQPAVAFGVQVGATDPSGAVAFEAVVDRRRGPARWRFRHGSNTMLHDGEVGVWWNDQAPDDVSELGPGTGAGPLDGWLSPIGLLVDFAFQEVEPVRLLGRDCVVARGHRRAGPVLHSRVPAPLWAEVVFDRETALLLRRQTWSHSNDLTSFEVDHLVVDGDLDEARLVAPSPRPPVAPPEPPEPLAVGLAERDERSVAEIGDYVSYGAPGDPTAAEAAIRQALTVLFQLSADGRDVVNVEGGAGLGPAATAARERVGGRVLSTEVKAVRFLAADRAVIFFRVNGVPIDLPVEGCMVLVDGAWLLERRTATRLLRMANVEIPPAP